MPVRVTRRVTTRPAELRADLRAAVPDALSALAVTAVIFWLLYWRVRAGVSPTVEVMPDMADANVFWMEWLCQAFGWSALIWSWATIMLGLCRSGPRSVWTRFGSTRWERWHRTTSLTSLGLMFAHAFLMLTGRIQENHEPALKALAETFVPGVFPTGFGKVGILIGLLGFYLAIPLSLGYYLRGRVGARTWRALHRFVVLAYALAVWHTLFYGNNVWFEGTLRTVVLVAQVPVAALLLARLLAPARLSGGWPTAVRVAGLAVTTSIAVVLLMVAISGDDGGHLHGAPAGTPPVQRWMVWVGFAALTAVLVLVTLRTRRRRTGWAARLGDVPASGRWREGTVPPPHRGCDVV